MILMLGESEPFVSELLTSLPTTIADLEPHQVGNMTQAESDPQKRDEYLKRPMELPNQKWVEIIGQARHSMDFLKDQDVIRIVLNILQELIDVESDGMADMVFCCIQEMDINNQMMGWCLLLGSRVTEWRVGCCFEMVVGLNGVHGNRATGLMIGCFFAIWFNDWLLLSDALLLSAQHKEKSEGGNVTREFE